MSDLGLSAPIGAPPSPLGGFSVQDIAPRLPVIDVRNVVNAINPLQPANSRGNQPIMTNAPRAAKALENKYSSYMRELVEQYDPRIITAMTNYDKKRVSQGQNPLSEEQTRRALETAQTGEAQTAPAEKSLNPLSLPKNILSNMGDIIKALPRLPQAAVKEVTDLAKFGEHMDAAKNPIAGLASAPGLRLIPGSYVVENIASGTPGELLRNPLFTALDVLPIAGKLAKGSRVAKEATDVAGRVGRGELTIGAADEVAAGGADITARDAATMRRIERRPIAGVINNMLDADGNVVRTATGEFIDQLTASRAIRPLNKWFSQGERNVSYAVSSAGQRVHNIVTGIQAPGTTAAAVLGDVAGGANGGLGGGATRADELGREAFSLREEIISSGVDEMRIPEVTNRLTTGNMDGLSEVEITAFERYRDLQSRIGDWSVQQNYTALVDGEIYDKATGADLLKARGKARDAATVNSMRQRLLGGLQDMADGRSGAVGSLGELRGLSRRGPREERLGSGTPAEQTAQRLIDSQTDAISQTEMFAARKLTLRGLEDAGYDLSHFNTYRTNKAGRQVARMKKGDEFWSAVDDVVEGRVELPMKYADGLMKLDEVMDVIAANKKGYKGTTLATLEAALKNQDWKTVSSALQSIKKQKGAEALSDPRFVESVRNIRENAKIMNTTRAFSDKKVASLQAAFDGKTARNAPARFGPEIGRRRDARMIERLQEEQFAIPADDALTAEKVVQLAQKGAWKEIPGFDIKMYNKLTRETTATWMDMKAQGFDPVFVHSVPTGRINRVLYPAQGIIPKDASSTKKRMIDMTPAAQDFTIAASDQMMEFISKREIETALKYIVDMKGESQAVLRERYYRAAERRAARSPVKDVEGHLQDLMTDNFRKFDVVEEGYNWGSPYLKKLADEQPWIPIGTYENLKSIADPGMIAGGMFDGLTKTFRIATVGLSIRTQIYNIIGGAISVELQSPGAMVRQGARVQQYMADVKAGIPSAWFDDELKTMTGSQKQSMLQLDDVAAGKVTEGAVNYLKGKKFKQWWDQIQQHKIDSGRVGKPKDFKGKIAGVTEKLYDFNGFFDDMYRMVSYYDELDRGVKKGMTRENASAAAIGQTRKVLQDWMGMTPMERGIMKSLVPFYGFVGHAVRFVLAYPLDHPLRAEIMTKLAMAELEDMEGMPTRFLSSVFFGEQDAKGNQTALNMAAMNPFGDVANMMTISGMLGATNPAISTALQMVGLDRGEAELYPSLRFDPETGRLSAQHGNPLMMLAENTIPQSALVGALLGINGEFNDALKRDPAAANRMLLSGMTLPILWRQYNIPQEQFKAEVARFDAQETVKNQALKSGDWTEALRYPSLAQYLGALDDLPDDQLSAFHPVTDDVLNNITSAALTGRPVGLPSITPLDDTVRSVLATGPGMLQRQGLRSVVAPSAGSGERVNLNGVPMGGSVGQTTGGI